MTGCRLSREVMLRHDNAESDIKAPIAIIAIYAYHVFESWSSKVK